eukprot:g5706.t1
MGTPLASIDWTFKGLLGLYWTPDELLVAVFQNGQVRIFDAFAVQKLQFTLDIGSESRLSLVAFWTGGIVVFGVSTKRLYVNLGFERRAPLRITDVVDVYAHLVDSQSGISAVTMAVLPDVRMSQGNAPGDAQGGGSSGAQASVAMELDDHQGDLSTSHLPGASTNPSSVFSLLPGAGGANSSDVRVLLSTEKHGVFVCSAQKCFQLSDDAGGARGMIGGAGGGTPHGQQLQQNSDPVTHFAVSPSGYFLALLSEKGHFKVFDNELQLLDVAHLESRKKPRQMVWVGEDCVALYMASTKQHALLVGGPRNDWIPYQYDHPLFLISEADGARLISQKCEILQRIPPAVECEFDEKNVSSLLQASVFGRTFLGTCLSPAGAEQAERASRRFVEACKWIRVAAALRSDYDVPITCSQLQQVGLRQMVMRLAARREHLIAKRISDWTGLGLTDKILVTWARDKILHSPSLTDAELCSMIIRKFQQEGSTSSPSASAGTGTRGDAPRKIVRYKYSGRPANQRVEELPVAMLLKLGESVLAFEQAALPKGDPELLRECLSHNNSSSGSSAPDAATAAATTMNQDLSAELLTSNLRSRCLHIHTLQKLQRWPALLAFCEGGYPNKRLIAEAQLMLGYMPGCLLNDRVSFLNKAALAFGAKSTITSTRGAGATAGPGGAGAANTAGAAAASRPTATSGAGGAGSGPDGGGSSPSKAAAQQAGQQVETIPADHFSAAVTQEQISLLKLQQTLEAKAKTNNWPAPPVAKGEEIKWKHTFIGRPLMQTIRLLVLFGEIQEADKVRRDFAIPEKRFWQWKISALAEARNVEEIVNMAKSRSSQSYVPIVEALIALGRIDLGKEFVSQVKDDTRAAQLLMKMGFRKEAEELSQKSNVGGILNWFKGRSQ